jgi:Coenzyme PQQ synthesis protein D (PqqD)
MSKSIRPYANHEGILVEEVDDEVLVYDERTQLARRLNRTAAIVWQHCDGEHDIPGLIEVLREEVGDLADEDLVMITLDQLHEQGLLESGYEPRDISDARVSRRRFIRRVGVVGTAAVALPVVVSIAAPAPAAAQSTSCICYCFFCSCGDDCYCEPCDFDADRQHRLKGP